MNVNKNPLKYQNLNFLSKSPLLGLKNTKKIFQGVTFLFPPTVYIDNILILFEQFKSVAMVMSNYGQGSTLLTSRSSQAAGRSWRRRWWGCPGSRGKLEWTTWENWGSADQGNNPGLCMSVPLMEETHTHRQMSTWAATTTSVQCFGRWCLPRTMTLSDMTRQKSSLIASARKLTDAGRKSYLFAASEVTSDTCMICWCVYSKI